MAKRRANKPRKESSADAANQEDVQIKEPEKATCITSYYLIEHRINAMRAICDAEIAHLLNQLHLMRSYFNKKQLDTPLIDFLKENCPNVLVTKATEDGEYELYWKTSTKYPDHEDIFPGNDGFEFSSKAVRESFLRTASIHIPDFVFEENWNSRTVGLHDSFQTPGVCVTNQRLSVGTTPKTLRLPKHGEMLLSVHGSPLGVYREGGMEAISESGDTCS
ncbi:uncharacterized protein LOC116248974 isoform X1 [Nymphaea colorata]|nr:uncharacterized protein LOC116248974 isoform X1 [Nymphaea colorata]XP_031477903.1 uncharacterized protein LOC116248974 isoform X1 [Nymphaea colorata]XP_031477904.1 uncharacterized protein LOC116248974 isoform X1 [Nymphaea colorata]XP_031477905.1 uncharacterized protein LOC116248974 isoform X1 [Nymphaea colorata]